MDLPHSYRLENCPVVEKKIPAPGFCRLILSAPAIVSTARPGQFVMVYLSPEQRHMLPRPMSICKVEKKRGEMVIFFALRGRGTELLARIEPGSSLKLLGPLGTGFPQPPPKSLLVAGGMGIAPLVFLAASAETPCTLIYGARTAAELACLRSDLSRPGLTVLEVTEDGSRGERGSALDLLVRLLPKAVALFACGPKPLLSAVASLATGAGIPAWVSVEERMACGIGACLGCAVKTNHGYRQVCRDGPVFKVEEVNLDD